jgi:PhnB protein
MQSALNPYISFKDNAREAMEFYQTVFGGKLEISTFKDFNAAEDPSEADKVMHAMLQADNGISFMASDTPDRMAYTPGARISMALSGDNVDELTGYFNKLSEGGKVVMPLGQAPWGAYFGMVVDRFGVEWMVNIAKKA